MDWRKAIALIETLSMLVTISKKTKFITGGYDKKFPKIKRKRHPKW